MAESDDKVLASLHDTLHHVAYELRILPQYQMAFQLLGVVNQRRSLHGLAPLSLAQVVEDAPPPVSDGLSPRPERVVGRKGTVSSEVQDAAAEFLQKIGRRAQTSEIAQEINRRGIRAGSPDKMVNTVSSYLSTAKDRFDNIKGQGYGLKEWSAPKLDASAQQDATTVKEQPADVAMGTDANSATPDWEAYHATK